MKAFRYFQVTLRLPEDQQSWWLAERDGGVFRLTAPAEDAPEIHAIRLRDELSGSELELVVRGDAEHRRPLAARHDPLLHLTRLFRGLAQIRAGLTLVALRTLRFLRFASEWEITLLREALTADESMNLLAEALLGNWQEPDTAGRAPLLTLAGIDDAATDEQVCREVGRWYGSARRWATRVVGFKFRADRFLREEAGREISRIAPGDACLLVREHHNRVDPNAIAVIHETGERLGYLRCDIAAHLAPHLDRGMLLAARVTALLPAYYPLDDRVHIVLERRCERQAA